MKWHEGSEWGSGSELRRVFSASTRSSEFSTHMLFLVGVWRHFAVVSVYSVCLFGVFFFHTLAVGAESGWLLAERWEASCVCVCCFS